MTGMEGRFFSNGRSCHLRLDDTGIMWRDTASEKLKHIPISGVVSCWMCPKGDKSCFKTYVESTDDDTLHPSFCVGDFRSTASTRTAAEGLTEGCFPSSSFINPVCSDSEVMDLAITSTDVMKRKTESGIIPLQQEISYSSNYRTFHSSRQDSVNLIDEQMEDNVELTLCKHEEDLQPFQHAGNFCLEFCERVRPSRLLRCLSLKDEAALVGAWQTRVVVFSHASRHVAQQWYQAVWDKIRTLKDRPRFLAVIVNPKSGNGDGRTVYRHQVAPLFARAGIATTVQETSPNFTGEAFARAAASTPGVDGVVVVGGDGVLMQVVMGLVGETAARAGVNTDDPHADLPRPELRVGMIPVGSTNCTLKCIQGVADPITATLHIVMGSRLNIDIAGVYSSTGPVSYITNIMAGGFIGTTNKLVDSFRRFSWMPVPLRHVLAAVWEGFKFRSYEVSLRFMMPKKPLATPFDDEICISGCPVCNSRDSGSSESDSRRSSNTDISENDFDGCEKIVNAENGKKWKTLSGRYYAVSALLVSSRGSHSSYGLSPAAHTGDGCCDVLLVPATGPLSFIAAMWRGFTQRNHLRHHGVTVVRCNAVTIESPVVLAWCPDGEVMEASSVNIRVHRQKLPVFARGIELWPPCAL